MVLGAGDSALIGAGDAHAAHAVDCELISVAVDPILLDELLTDFGWFRPDVRPVFRRTVIADTSVAQLAGAFARELTPGLPGQGAMIDSLIRQLGIHLLRSHYRVRRDPEVEHSRAGPVDRRLRRAIELMHARTGDDLSLKELAEAVFLSEHYFAHLFKEVTGLTPHAYLANVRMERARTLLVETSLSITRIAAEVGYRSPSHFANAFRSVTGASPRAYRAAAEGAMDPGPPQERN